MSAPRAIAPGPRCASCATGQPSQTSLGRPGAAGATSRRHCATWPIKGVGCAGGGLGGRPLHRRANESGRFQVWELWLRTSPPPATAQGDGALCRPCPGRKLGVVPWARVSGSPQLMVRSVSLSHTVLGFASPPLVASSSVFIGTGLVADAPTSRGDRMSLWFGSCGG